MILLPDEELGVFYSYNSAEGLFADEELLTLFIDEFYPYSNIPEPMEGSSANLDDFAGIYVSARRHYNEYIIKSTFITETEIFVNPRDYLSQSFEFTVENEVLLLSGALEFVQVESDYFVEATGEYDYEIYFIRNSRNQVTHLYANFVSSTIAYEKMHQIYENQPLSLSVVSVVSAGIFLFSLAWWLIDFIIKKRKRKVEPFYMNNLKIYPAMVLTTVVTTSLIVNSIVNNNVILVGELATKYPGLSVSAIMTSIFIGLMVVGSLFSWTGIEDKEKKPYWNIWDRILYTVITVLSGIYIWLFVFWELFG
jgi:hypothetical protein